MRDLAVYQCAVMAPAQKHSLIHCHRARAGAAKVWLYATATRSHLPNKLHPAKTS